ncbi:MAG TPA: hypothetical protein EYG51_22095 [Pseudomonadales bacterium]|nr:hypothetical protein [Pseudomonadales bacterium]
MRITKSKLKRIIREEVRRISEDHIADELEHLRKNIRDDEEHIDALEKDIEDEREEEERARHAEKTHESARATKRRLRRAIRSILGEDKSGKGKCPSTGCVTERGGSWRIISNKTGKLWPQTYDTKADAEAALGAYHGGY